MNQCVLYTTKYKEELLEKLSELEYEAEWMNQINVVQNGNLYKLNYEAGKLTTHHLEGMAHVISDVVQKQVIMKVTKEYLSTRKDLALLDKKEIQKNFITNHYLSKQEGFSYLTYYLIYMPILEALKESETFNVDGWLRFRIARCKIILRDMLEQFIEDYLIKKDLISFIKLIREINILTEPLEDTLHLVYEKDGGIKMMNQEMKDVTNHYINQYCKDLLTDSTLNKQDLIMNILLTVCPRHIIIHQRQKAKKPQFIKALEGIFGMNISYCKGCSYCTIEENLITE